MKDKTYNRWVNKKVRHRSLFPGVVGLVVRPATTAGWWVVEWPDRSTKQYPERELVVVEQS